MKKFMLYKEEKMKQKNKRIVNSSKSLATVRERERERESYTLINKNSAFLNALFVMQKLNLASLCLLAKININKEKVKDSNRAY